MPEPTNIHRVLKGKMLHLPGNLINHKRGPERIWLREGQALDLADPFLAHCVVGQEYKLEPAPCARATVPEHRLIAAFRREWEGKPAPAPANAKAEEAVGAAASETLGEGIEAPDVPAPTGRKVKA